MKNLRIVFMGTPEFAVATLGCLLMNGFNVVAVVTAPDKPAGRGRKLNKSAVKEFAENCKLPVLQPTNLKDPEFTDQLKQFNADLFIVVAFRMLPEIVWKMPSTGTINLHASLLPDYRGAAPINHAIINGETRTGVTTFFINEKIDTGNILLREEVQIFPFDNAGDLHDRLKLHGARLLIRTLEKISQNNISPLPQSELSDKGKTPKEAPKIHPSDCIINWNKSAVNIHNLIRGLSPYPGARTFIRNDKSVLSVKIFESRPNLTNHKYNPGHIVTEGKNSFMIACGEGFLNVQSLQVEGRKKMSCEEFLRGFKLSDYTITDGLPQ